MPDIAPLYFTVDSDGAIQAVFPGGIDMLAADVGTPPKERRITWRRESDGALVAYESAFTGTGAGAQDSLSLTVGGSFSGEPDTGNERRLDLNVAAGGGNDGAGLGLGSTNAGIGGGGVPYVSAAAQDVNGTSGEGPSYATIVDAGGRSSFLKSAAQSVFGAAFQAVYFAFGPSVSVPALAAGATASSASFDSGLPTTTKDGATFNFVRVFGAYLNVGGNNLAYGFSVNTAGATVVVQASHRNVGVASGIVSFGQVVIVGYS